MDVSMTVTKYKTQNLNKKPTNGEMSNNCLTQAPS